MDLQALYNSVSLKISTLNHDEFWPGFSPVKFALYSDSECFFHGNYIEKTDDFCANCAIRYNQEYIAIWHVMGDMDMDVLTSKIVHEMFHAYQFTKGWDCFPDEMDALTTYRYFAKNLNGKLYESELIISLAEEFDANKYKELLALRKYRSESFPYEYQYESKVEEIEGTANYVEWMALKQLDENKANAFFERMKNSLMKPEHYFPIRISSYSIGALMIYVARLAGTYQYEDCERPFGNRLIKTKGIEDTPFDKSRIDDIAMIKEIDSYNVETKRIIKEAITKNEILLEGPLELVGVNIYDARHLDEYITSRFFLAYRENNNIKVKNGNFVIRMRDGKTIDLVYRWD